MKVELVTHTLNPDRVCDMSASTCVSQEIPELNNVFGSEAPKLNALKGALKSGHESVVEHASFTFAISGVSRALTHQLVRHRIASFSQQSQRYVNMNGFEYVIPDSIKNHEITWDEEGKTDVARWYTNVMEGLSGFYATLIEAGIPEEDARYILPNACCTNIIVTMNARELRHFFRLRCCERAQWEIREMANLMLDQVKKVAPIIFADAGASCVATGRCPEGKKSCGKVKKSQKTSYKKRLYCT